MKNMYSTIAIVLGVLLAIPTLKEGISVIMGKEKVGMVVLYWLVYYNVFMALFSLFVVFTIWRNYSFKQKLSYIVLLGHLIVLLTLIGIYFTGGSVANKSIMAMTMRSTVWGIINFFVWKQSKIQTY